METLESEANSIENKSAILIVKWHSSTASIVEKFNKLITFNKFHKQKTANCVFIRILCVPFLVDLKIVVLNNSIQIHFFERIEFFLRFFKSCLQTWLIQKYLHCIFFSLRSFNNIDLTKSSFSNFRSKQVLTNLRSVD